MYILTLDEQQKQNNLKIQKKSFLRNFEFVEAVLNMVRTTRDLARIVFLWRRFKISMSNKKKQFKVFLTHPITTCIKKFSDLDQLGHTRLGLSCISDLIQGAFPT